MFNRHLTLILVAIGAHLSLTEATVTVPGDESLHEWMHMKLFSSQYTLYSAHEVREMIEELRDYYKANNVESTKVKELYDAGEVDEDKCTLDAFGELEKLKHSYRWQNSIAKYLESNQNELVSLCKGKIEDLVEKGSPELSDEQRQTLAQLKTSLEDVPATEATPYVKGVVLFLERKLGPLDVFVKRQNHQDGFNQIARVYDREVGDLCRKVNQAGRELMGVKAIKPSEYLIGKLRSETLREQVRNLVNCHNIAVDYTIADKIYGIVSNRHYKPADGSLAHSMSKFGFGGLFKLKLSPPGKSYR